MCIIVREWALARACVSVLAIARTCVGVLALTRACVGVLALARACVGVLASGARVCWRAGDRALACGYAYISI